MSAETVQQFEQLEAQASGLMSIFIEAGYEPVAPSILQPADVFLDEIGERLRARTYVFTDPDGEELCLRPDLTVPAARLFLERHPEAGSIARYCYNGPAFRYQPGGASAALPREFRQAGVEFFASNEKEKAEAEIVALALEAVRSAGLEDFVLKMGDLGLFFALVDALDIPQRWRERLKHHFWKGPAFRDVLADLSRDSSLDDHELGESLLQKLDPENEDDALEIVADYMDEKSIPLIGLRSLNEITERLLHLAADHREDPLPQETVDLIESYLAISGPPKAAGARIGDLASSAGIDLSASLKSYTKRLDLFTKTDIDLSSAQFSAEFGRNFEYYTGFVFQLEIPGMGRAGQIAGGGRYDSLLQRVGAAKQVPAIGVAIHTERLLGAVQGGLA